MNERTIVTSRKINKKVIQGRYRIYSLIFIFIRILDKFFPFKFCGLDRLCFGFYQSADRV